MLVAGLVAHTFHASTRSVQVVSSGHLVPSTRPLAREGDDAGLRQACQSLRVFLRSHLAGGEAASAAFCTWTVAIVEGSPRQTQAVLLATGILDPVFDRISRKLHVRDSGTCTVTVSLPHRT